MYTEHLTEIEDGIWVDEHAKDTNTKSIEAHYTNNAMKILEVDKYHYTCMARKFADTEIFSNEFYSVADIAGGHPKLASKMNIAGTITVYDQYAEMYEGLHDEFVKHYPCENVVYEKKAITHPQFSPKAELAICSHILEHLTIEQIRRLLANLQTDKVVVYGPNIGVARRLNWLHFKPLDHRTFCTTEAMVGLVQEAGFVVKESIEYHEDHLIYGDR